MAETTKRRAGLSTQNLQVGNSATTVRLVRTDMARLRAGLVEAGMLDSMVEKLGTWEQSLGNAERTLRQIERDGSPALASALTGLLDATSCTGEEPEVVEAREALVEAGYPDPLDFGEGP